MEKTEMMKRFEAETGEILDIDHLSADANGLWYGYIEELEAELRGLKLLNKWSKEELIQCQAKADAYDRLMSGGKKTLKEWANILGKPVAVDVEGRLCWFPKKPEIGLTTWIWYDEQFGCFGEYLPKNLIDFTGDWQESLTLPDGWEAKDGHQ